MNRKLLLTGYILAAVLAVSACAPKQKSAARADTEISTPTAEETTVPSAGTKSAQETTSGSPEMIEEHEETEATRPAGATPITKEAEAFAESIQEAVADGDMEALSQLCAYPVYVVVEGQDGKEIRSPEEFAALGAADVLTDQLIRSVSAVDTAQLFEVEAGYVMGDVCNIIFKQQPDGTYGITGINQ